MRLYPSTAVKVTPMRTLNFQDRAQGDLLYSIPYLQRHNPAFTASLVPFLRTRTRYVAAYDFCDNRTKILVDDTGKLDLSNREWQDVSSIPLSTPAVLHVLPKAARASPP